MHFTSPIRRIADYISHRQLVCLIEGREEHYSPEQIEELCKYINLQLTATLTNQKEELLDMHGKRIIRKWKKVGDELYSSMKSHIKQRLENGLRTPRSIREEIVKQIREKWKVEDWIIRKFLLSWENEIIEEMRDTIISDHSTRKYINIFWSIPWIDFTESQFIDRVSWDYGNDMNTNHLDTKKRKVIEIWEEKFNTTVEQFRRAKVKALKKAIIRTFDIIL